VSTTARNVDPGTVAGFGDEWRRFDQSDLGEGELTTLFEQYFRVFPWSSLPANAVGFDLGCGSGRWAMRVADRVGRLHCIDASEAALAVSRRNLGAKANVVLHHASVDAIPLPDSSMDFGYSLGVLHHVPDTAAGLRSCVSKLKPGAPFLVYLYYAFDNRPLWFRRLWQISDLGRTAISRLPPSVRYAVSQAIAGGVYFPFARGAAMAERLGFDVGNLPLSAYRARSFYVMRNDALDRFGTRLEKRFTAKQIEDLMLDAGLANVRFNDAPPFWCAVGERAR
jgi:SAM-dependent methyltransferase